jgi:hypothetical protein
VVNVDGIYLLPGDLLGAGLDRLDCRAPDQMGPAADHPTGALAGG